jgi:5-methylcytosine-specific restriction endonuclease McrA
VSCLPNGRRSWRSGRSHSRSVEGEPHGLICRATGQVVFQGDGYFLRHHCLPCCDGACTAPRPVSSTQPQRRSSGIQPSNTRCLACSRVLSATLCHLVPRQRARSPAVRLGSQLLQPDRDGHAERGRSAGLAARAAVQVPAVVPGGAGSAVRPGARWLRLRVAAGLARWEVCRRSGGVCAGRVITVSGAGRGS